MIRKLLKSNRGDAACVETAITMLILLICIVTAINVYFFFTLHSKLDYFAREMVISAAAAGDTASAAVSDRYHTLAAEVGFSPTISWTADYMDGTKVQYGKTLQVTLTTDVSFSGLGLAADIPMHLTAQYSGISQKYWK